MHLLLSLVREDERISLHWSFKVSILRNTNYSFWKVGFQWYALCEVIPLKVNVNTGFNITVRKKCIKPDHVLRVAIGENGSVSVNIQMSTPDFVYQTHEGLLLVEKYSKSILVHNCSDK